MPSTPDNEPFVREDEREHLYSGEHVVQVGSNVNNQQNVRLTIEQMKRNKFLKKVLNIKMTDDKNPFFIYTLELSDEDYGHLKTIQGLLIDFCHFPNELISLLQKCRNQQEANIKFFVTFEENSNFHNNKDEVVLKIMETNCLKLLCHLALTLKSAPIGEVKKEVLSKMTHLKGVIQAYDFNQRELENNIQELARNLEQRNKESEELKCQWDEQQRSWGQSLTKQINEIRDEYFKKHSDAVFEMKQKEEETKLLHSTVVEQLKDSLEVLKIEKGNLVRSNEELDLTVRNQACKINGMEEKIESLEKNLQHTKYALQEKTKDVEMKDMTIKTLRARLSSVDKLHKDSVKKNTAFEKLIEEMSKEKHKMSDMMKMQEKSIMNNSEHLKSVCGDLVKANDIIKQLQKENNVSKAKLTKALQYFQEQTTKLMKCSEQLHAMKEASEAKKKELDYLQKTAISTNETLKELKKDLLSTKQITRMHDKEIMDLKQQPVVKDKINDQLRKQCLKNVYLSRPTALAECGTNAKTNGTSDEESLYMNQQDKFVPQNCNSTPVFKATTESTEQVHPVTSVTQSYNIVLNKKIGSELKKPNIPIVDTDDEKQLSELNKQQKNSVPVQGKATVKKIGIRRMVGNKSTGYPLASYFQKPK